MVMREVDEDLAKEKNNQILIEDLNVFDGSTDPKADSLLMTKALQPDTVENTANNDDFLNLQSDYEGNLKQCDEEVEGKESGPNQAEIPNSEANSLKSNASRGSSTSANRRKSLSSRDPTKSKPSSTPTSRATLSSSKTMPRSSAPSRATSTSSTPTGKPTTLSSNLSARDRSSSGKKMGPTMMSKSSTPVHGVSQMVRPRPSSAFNGKPKQKSRSPGKARANSNRTNGSGDDDVNPVLMGTKMVARVVNMRKLAPPKQEDYVSVDKTKKSSVENSGFGRSLSKKSLDMALRHMDIGRSIS